MIKPDKTVSKILTLLEEAGVITCYIDKNEDPYLCAKWVWKRLRGKPKHIRLTLSLAPMKGCGWVNYELDSYDVQMMGRRWMDTYQGLSDWMSLQFWGRREGFTAKKIWFKIEPVRKTKRTYVRH